MRFPCVVDRELAAQMSADAMELWEFHVAMPSAPLFAGGVFTDWPNWTLEALAICRDEQAAVDRLIAWQQAKDAERRKGG